jgi:hypothetical protein
MNENEKRITHNLQTVQEKIACACQRAKRKTEAVNLVAVTKTVTCAEIEILHQAGIKDFGENRVQVALEKINTLKHLALNWHLIGHLQRNKAKLAVPNFTLYHSVESLKLIETMARLNESEQSPLEILLEINISGETSKYGIQAANAKELLLQACKSNKLKVTGLMTMAPYSTTPEDSRPYFRQLRQLRNELSNETGLDLPHLSMGMSGDYEIAIEEGATIIRVGSALFY